MVISGEYSNQHLEYIKTVLPYLPVDEIKYHGEVICKYYIEYRTPTTVQLHLVFSAEFFRQFKLQPKYTIRRVREFLSLVPARRVEVYTETEKAGRFVEFFGFEKVCVMDKYFNDTDFILYRRINEQ